MLQALLTELKALPDLQATLMLDARCEITELPADTRLIRLSASDDYRAILSALLDHCDVFWPIAPEADRILADIKRLADHHGKPTVLPDIQTIELCTDKLATFRQLQACGLPVIATFSAALAPVGEGAVVIKPRDGVGCDACHVLADGRMLDDFLDMLSDKQQFIVQPYVDGDTLSLSCLFRDGRGELLCVNRQHLHIHDGRIGLAGCTVNVEPDRDGRYRQLVERIGAALPGLFGYIGIDIIATPSQGPVIVEINPRLTTSYAGIGAALGINVAARMLQNRAVIEPGGSDRAVYVAIGGYDA